MQLRSVYFLVAHKKWRIGLFAALIGVLATFGLCLLASSPALAADATVKGNILTYRGDTYSGPALKESGDGLPKEIPDGNIYYSSSSGDVNSRKVTYIFITDKDAKKAKVAIYKYVPPDTYTLDGKVQDIGLANDGSIVAPTSQSASTPPAGQGCTDSFGAVSWIACSLSDVMSKAVDGLYGMLEWFLIVKPLSTDTNSPIYMVWSYMRSIANIMFIIFMLIVIYSQVTGLGITNYGIKKVLPRIAIAALLVNLSYFICTIGVDLSNIIGDQLNNLFMGIKDQAVAAGALDINLDWGDLIETMVGGAAVGGLALLGLAAVGGFSGLWFLLAPILLGAVIAILAAVITLAARQAIIILLVIVSPLAFVAYLLPNTDTWFKKWRELGMKMLILYPAFSLLFGAAQLAGWTIVASSSSIIQVLLGLAVQVIPLIFTPWLAKLSGSILGSVNSAIKKPFSPLNTAVKSWGGDKQAIAKARKLQNFRDNQQNYRGIRRIGPTSAGYRLEESKRRRLKLKEQEEGTVSKNFEATFDDEVRNGYRARSRNQRPDNSYYSMRNSRFRLEESTSGAERAKNLAESTVNSQKATAGTRLNLANTGAEVAKLENTRAQKSLELFLDQQKAIDGTELSVANLGAEDMTAQSAAAQKVLERFLAGHKTRPAGALFASNLTLEAETMNTAAAQKTLERFLTMRKTQAGTELNVANTNLTAQTDWASAATKDLEGYLNVQRSTNNGNDLNRAYLDLETSTLGASADEEGLKKYIDDEKARVEREYEVTGEDADGNIVTRTVREFTALGLAEKRAKAAKYRADYAASFLANEMNSTGERAAGDITLAGPRTAEAQEMVDISSEMANLYSLDSAQKRRAKNLDMSDIKGDYERVQAAALDDASADYDALIRGAAGGRGEEGERSIIANAMAMQDAEEKRILEETTTWIGKKTQNRPADLAEVLKKAMRENDTFTARAAENLLVSKGGGFGVKVLSRAIQDLSTPTPENTSITDKSWGILSANTGVGAESAGIKKSDVFLFNWAKQTAGKDADGNYTFDKTTQNFNNWRIEDGVTGGLKSWENFVTSPSDVYHQSNDAITFAGEEGLLTPQAARDALIAGVQTPDIVDATKLTNIGRYAGIALEQASPGETEDQARAREDRNIATVRAEAKRWHSL